MKILCTPKAQKEGPMNATLHNKGFAHWLGAICHAQSLYVWVPAHWAPCICTVVKNRTAEFDRKRDHEALLARAWGHEVEQQAQRDGAGIASHDGLPLAELSHVATCQATETAPSAAATDYTVASSSANGIGDAVSEREQYPVEYAPFDRPVEEVVMNLFEGDPPANTPPTKRRKGNDQ